MCSREATASSCARRPRAGVEPQRPGAQQGEAYPSGGGPVGLLDLGGSRGPVLGGAVWSSLGAPSWPGAPGTPGSPGVPEGGLGRTDGVGEGLGAGSPVTPAPGAGAGTGLGATVGFRVDGFPAPPAAGGAGSTATSGLGEISGVFSTSSLKTSGYEGSRVVLASAGSSSSGASPIKATVVTASRRTRRIAAATTTVAESRRRRAIGAPSIARS